MTTIVCVLKTGGEYRAEHVERLRRQIAANAPAGTKFTCLTDDAEVLASPWAAPLTHDWPGWWSKLDVLSVLGPVVYLDLDVSVVGSLSPLLEQAACRDFIMCRGFWGAEDPSHVNSTVMGWRADAPSKIPGVFALAPQRFMARYATPERWGDQVFVRDHLGREPAFWQDFLPGAVLSWKRDVLRGADRSGCTVIAHHGQPRPWGRGGADELLASLEPRAA